MKKGFFASLTPEQQEAVLNFKGPEENLGSLEECDYCPDRATGEYYNCPKCDAEWYEDEV